jgi:DNA-binding MarR family transcriptional regulator
LARLPIWQSEGVVDLFFKAVQLMNPTDDALPQPGSNMRNRAGRHARSDIHLPTEAQTAQVSANFEHYVPAYLSWIANKLSHGASVHYTQVFGVGIEVWRCLVVLAVEGPIAAQEVSRVVGMDKASVSRCLKQMHARGLITLEIDASDRRMHAATLTRQGRALHDRILGIARERERAFLSVLSKSEQETLIALLRRLHDNLHQVEEATVRHVERHFPEALARRWEDPSTHGDGQ